MIIYAAVAAWRSVLLAAVAGRFRAVPITGVIVICAAKAKVFPKKKKSMSSFRNFGAFYNGEPALHRKCEHDDDNIIVVLWARHRNFTTETPSLN